MKNLLIKFRSFDYRYYVIFGICAFFLVYIGFNIIPLTTRLWVSMKVFGSDFIYYFVSMVNRGFPKPEQTLTILSAEYGLVSLLPTDFLVFINKFAASLVMIFNFDNFIAFLSAIPEFFLRIMLLLNFLALLIPVVVIYFSSYFSYHKTELDKPTKPLIFWHKIYDNVLFPVMSWIKDFYHFVLSKKLWVWVISILFFFSINAIPVAIDVLAWYFYFVASFDFGSIYHLVLMALIDLFPFLNLFPGIVYLILAYLLFDLIRKKIGYRRLEHFENYNKGFVSSTGVSVFITGAPRTGKTLLNTDMGLSCDVIFRSKALEKIEEIEFLFPKFPWRSFEAELTRLIELKPGHKNRIYNRVGIKDWISKKEAQFNRRPSLDKIFGYDYVRNPLYVYNALGIETIWTSLSDYGQCFLMYAMSNSFLVPNYAIRTDSIKYSQGYFPRFDLDFFHRDINDYVTWSRFSKILDDDSLRWGKQIIKNSENSYVMDMGIVNYNEVGKERLNQNSTKFMKPDDNEANQLNDNFNNSIKMGGQAATVRFFTFWKMIFDDQRLGTTNVDLTGLCETLIHIVRQDDEIRSAMPLYWLEPIILTWLFDQIKNANDKFKFNRGDNTLLMAFLRKFGYLLYMYLLKRTNTFGFKQFNLKISDGTVKDSVSANQKYFILLKKAYAYRYHSATYSEFFDNNFRKSSKGFIDLPEYSSSKASYQEHLLRHSYFVGSLMRLPKRDVFGSEYDDGELVI